MSSTLSRVREWATPITVGVFVLMAATGVLMFFHADTSLQKEVHEWAGWVMVAGVAGHAVANWPGLRRYLRLGRPALLMGVFVLVLAGSFFAGGGADDGPPPPVMAMQAISRAPIGRVAALYGQSGEQARQALAAQGIVLASDEATLASAIGEDRGRLGQALRALAQPH